MDAAIKDDTSRVNDSSYKEILKMFIVLELWDRCSMQSRYHEIDKDKLLHLVNRIASKCHLSY